MVADGSPPSVAAPAPRVRAAVAGLAPRRSRRGGRAAAMRRLQIQGPRAAVAALGPTTPQLPARVGLSSGYARWERGRQAGAALTSLDDTDSERRRRWGSSRCKRLGGAARHDQDTCPCCIRMPVRRALSVGYTRQSMTTEIL